MLVDDIRWDDPDVMRAMQQLEEAVRKMNFRRSVELS